MYFVSVTLLRVQSDVMSANKSDSFRRCHVRRSKRKWVEYLVMIISVSNQTPLENVDEKQLVTATSRILYRMFAILNI